MATPLKNFLPPIYRDLLPELFDRPKIEEKRATCDNCAMCDRGGQEANVAMEYFKPDLKCCTYDPLLPNYLVGAIFADPDPAMEEGRNRIRARIQSRVGVTPHRVCPPRKKALHAQAAVNANFFGRSYAIVCPYLEREKGLCTIWRHREAVCSTYYCKYTHGVVGYEHWRALKEFLGYAEYLLSKWAAETVDPGTIEPQIKRGELTLEDLEDRPPEDETYSKWWAEKWVGREEEFYVKCYELVSKLTRLDFNRIVFSRKEPGQWLETATKRYDEANSPILPSHLVRSKRIRERDGGETLVISTYNRFDSFVIERDLYDVLGMLDADKTVEENLKKLDEEYGIELHPDLLRELYRQSVLVPPVVEADPKTASEGQKPST